MTRLAARFCVMVAQSTLDTHDDESPPGRVGIFDAGIGGLPLAGFLRKSRPDVEIVYLGDAGRRPYGPRPGPTVARFVREAELFMGSRQVDAWAIACNTASVVAPPVHARILPTVDMVGAIGALVPAHSSQDRIALLGTAGTIASGEIQRRYPSTSWAAIPTEDLLREAEEGGHHHEIVARHLTTLAGQLVKVGATQAVLACTDFTCILPQMRAQLPDIGLLDPVKAAVERLADLVPLRLDSRPPRHELFLTGRHPCDVPQLANQTYGIDFEIVTTVDLNPTKS